MRKSAKANSDIENVPRGTNGEIKTAADLARALGVRHQIITAHYRKPGAPPFSNIEEWREFLQKVTLKGTISAELSEKIAEQRLRNLKQDADDKERESKRKAGELIEASEVNRVALAVYSFFFGELDRQRQTWPALFKGRTELEIYEIIQGDNLKIKSGLMARLKEFLK